MRVVMRGLEVALLAAGVVLAIGFGVVCIRGTAQERHQRELDRIADWVGRARISLPAGEPVLGWQNLLTAIHNSLYNPLGSVRYTPTDKVRALADALDASGAQDLATVDGVFESWTGSARSTRWRPITVRSNRRAWNTAGPDPWKRSRERADPQSRRFFAHEAHDERCVDCSACRAVGEAVYFVVSREGAVKRYNAAINQIKLSPWIKAGLQGRFWYELDGARVRYAVFDDAPPLLAEGMEYPVHSVSLAHPYSDGKVWLNLSRTERMRVNEPPARIYFVQAGHVTSAPLPPGFTFKGLQSFAAFRESRDGLPGFQQWLARQPR